MLPMKVDAALSLAIGKRRDLSSFAMMAMILPYILGRL